MRHGYEGDTLLHQSVSYNYIDDENVEDVLQHEGTDPNAANSNGETALHRCAMFAYFRGMELIMQYGGSLRVRDQQGQNPFHYAILSGIFALETIQFLEQYDFEALYQKDLYGNRFDS
jgi:ankyrin repeat protein